MHTTSKSTPVAQFVANPIEIVEYHRHHCQCTHGGTLSAADWLDEIISGQDVKSYKYRN